MKKELFNKLLSRAKHDKQAASQIYSHYYPPLVLHIRRVYRGKVDGQDIAQEVFIKLLSMEAQEYINYPTSWIYKIADNIANDALKKDNKRVTAETGSAVSGITYLEVDARDFLKVLNDELKEIVYLHYWERYTLIEIAGLLGMNYNTVKKKHRIAKRILSKEYSGEERK